MWRPWVSRAAPELVPCEWVIDSRDDIDGCRHPASRTSIVGFTSRPGLLHRPT